ncbi:MAG TPA: NAD(P)-binding domain-containing protein [Polyangiaceae bacterium]|nr:NAD(P)-binding domain-containing protein [Polyangiaceae bacterium]
MNIGIVGTGGVGRALGILWSGHGHELFFGASTAGAAREAAAKAGGRSGGLDEAVRFGDALLYTLRSGPGPSSCAGAALRDKIVIDCRERLPGERTNPVEAPGARLVRAFFEVPQEAFDLCDAVPLCEYGVPFFLCGDDAGAKAVAASLAEQIGFSPVDCGPLRNAHVVGALGGAIRLLSERDALGRAEPLDPLLLEAA